MMAADMTDDEIHIATGAMRDPKCLANQAAALVVGAGDHVMCDALPPHKFNIGDPVYKFTGDYQIFGEVRGVFTMAGGAVRYAVEHKAEGGGSFLHVYSEANLQARYRR
jgi:hypothetical protein